MEEKAELAWAAVIKAEAAYVEALAALRQHDIESVLREALSQLRWRRQALAVVRAGEPYWAVRLLPELLNLSLSAHSLLAEVRRCILQVPREVLETAIPAHVERVVGDPQSDDEAYRRTAELLHELDMPWLLEVLLDSAEQSANSHIRQVASDFRSADEG